MIFRKILKNLIYNNSSMNIKNEVLMIKKFILINDSNIFSLLNILNIIYIINNSYY